MKPKITATGTPIARERRDGGEVKLSTFIPLKIRKRSARKVMVRQDIDVISPRKLDEAATRRNRYRRRSPEPTMQPRPSFEGFVV